jgi:radical SAM protein with 4Fe4S-binding SPASM domain
VGNIREHKLADIIKGSEVINNLKNYRQMIKGECRDCDKAEECYGCRGAAFQLTGDYLASDPTCWRNNCPVK